MSPIQVVDDSFNQTLFSTSTDENGLASFPLSLLNLSAGIHVINLPLPMEQLRMVISQSLI